MYSIDSLRYIQPSEILWDNSLGTMASIVSAIKHIMYDALENLYYRIFKHIIFPQSTPIAQGLHLEMGLGVL